MALQPQHIAAPATLASLAITDLTIIGDPALLDQMTLALFSSVQCPGHIILKLHDRAHELAAAGTGVISPFHSPLEQEALTILLRGQGPLVICPARGIGSMRIPQAYRPHIDAGRLAILSPFPDTQKRATQQIAALRNQMVALLAQRVLIAHAAPGGKMAAFCAWLTMQNHRIERLD
ncbi:MAG: hypothetical protein R2867_21510 [Caldilineaceae bacterium]